MKNKEIELSDPNFVRDFIFIDDVIDAYMYFLNGKNIMVKYSISGVENK